MKKIIALLFFTMSLFSCQKDLVEKPDNLIDKKMMGDIIYDMTLLEALRFQDPNSLVSGGVNPKNYIYKKYKIDSLQFAKSSVYYASQYSDYKEIYEKINERLLDKKKSLEKIIKKEEAQLKKAKEKRAADSIKKAREPKPKELNKKSETKAEGGVVI